MSEPIYALDSDTVAKLVGVPKSTLTSWERRGVFKPSYFDPLPGSLLSRVYSFRDVVSLRALAQIRRQLSVPFEEIQRAGDYLSQHYDSTWSELRFGVIDRRLLFRDPGSKRWIGHDGQGVLELDLSEIPKEIEHRAKLALLRDAADSGLIVRNRYVQHNNPILAGTRIPTSTIWVYHEDGFSADQIIEQFPQLTNADIEAAIAYESRLRQVA